MLSAKKNKQKIHSLNKFISETDSFVGRSILISKLSRVPIIKGIFVMEVLKVSNAYAFH